MLSTAWQWSDQNFCERVVRRCQELGRSQRAVLKEAQCAHDYLQTNPAHGRRIDRISRIAEVLEIPLGGLLGLPAVTAQIDIDVLLIAYQVARDVTQLVRQPTDRIFVETMTAVYMVLLDRKADGHDPADPQFLKQATDMFRAMAATRSP